MAMVSLMAVSANAQNRSITFEKPNFESAVKKAKKQKKLIFIDFHTTWCGPCKDMAKNIFTLDEVADKYNKNFICLKLDAEKDADGVTLSKKYGVKAYPTMIFVDPNSGEPAHIAVGGGKAETLIANADAALDMQNNFGALKKRYESGERDIEFIAKYMSALGSAYMDDTRATVFSDFLSTLKNEEYGTPQVWLMFCNNISDPTSDIFSAFLDRKALICKTINKVEVDKKFNNSLSSELYNTLYGMKGIGANERLLPHLYKLIDISNRFDDASTPGNIAAVEFKIAVIKKDSDRAYQIFCDIYNYNLFRGQSDYNFLFRAGDWLKASVKDTEKLKNVMTILDKLLDKPNTNKEYHRAVHVQRSRILEVLGDTAAAAEAKKIADELNKKTN